MLSSWYNIVVIGFNPTNYTVKESDGSLRVTAMILEGYISDGENATVAVSTRGGTATGTCTYIQRIPMGQNSFLTYHQGYAPKGLCLLLG